MITVNLVGNANTGKTTLFNTLTHSHEHVGNWHGVTVEEKSGKYNYKGCDIAIVDLPGIYSMTPLSFEEKVATDYILKHRDRIIVNICDASNLQRNLYLTLNLMELGCNIILAVNQIDKRRICKIDFDGLSKALGLNIVYLNAGDRRGAGKLSDAILALNESLSKGEKNKVKLGYVKEILAQKAEKLKNFGKIIAKKCENNDNLSNFYKIKLLEDDEEIKKLLNIDNTFDDAEFVADKRYAYIDTLMSKYSSPRTHTYGQSRLDKILLNRYLALPIFLLLLFGCFYLTFFSIGAWLSDGLSFLLDKFVSTPILNFLTSRLGEGSWVVSLVDVALVGGVGTVLGFLPQVALLFFFLSILEDSGYLSRVAFVFEDILGKVGVSGKSVYTLLMGFGCSTTAVLTARNMEDKNSKIKIGLLTPYMSCSAKFPIYTVLGGAFFGANNIFVIMGLYLLGVVIAVLLSYVLEKTVLKSKEQSFILEFPPYRMMSFKRTFSLLWQNVKQFITRVASLILAMNIIVWLLSNFTITFHFIGQGDGVSMLETFGRVLAPLFIPLGFNSWGLVSALIAGLVAKEVIVSSIAMFNGAEESIESIQSSHKWTFIGIAIEFVIAYLTAFFVYTIARTVEVFGFWKVFATIFAIIIIVLAVVYVVRRIKKRKLCPYSDRCNKKCK